MTQKNPLGTATEIRRLRLRVRFLESQVLVFSEERDRLAKELECSRGNAHGFEKECDRLGARLAAAEKCVEAARIPAEEWGNSNYKEDMQRLREAIAAYAALKGEK